MTERSGQAASRGIGNYDRDRVGTTSRAARGVAAFEVFHGFRRDNRVRIRLLVFQSPLLASAINLLQVRDTGVLLGRRTGFHEVRDRNRGQQTNDGHHDHDFYQRETALARCLDLHTFAFFDMQRGRGERRVIMNTVTLSTDCLSHYRNELTYAYLAPVEAIFTEIKKAKVLTLAM